MKNTISQESLNQLRNLFEPRSVAIVGASNKIDTVGGAITRNFMNGGFRGEYFLVNPNAKQIFGEEVYSSLEDVSNNIDLVEIVVPASLVPTIMEQAAKKEIKNAIIISSGFAEIGKIALQNQVVDIAKKNGMRVIGPNCFGLINTSIDLDLSFTFSKALKGSIAFISQSGAMCCGTLDWAQKEEIGFSKFINLGNKCDVDESDVLAYLSADPQTRTIAIYQEGINDGRKFFESVKHVTKEKPVIILKAGITEPGARAALSHTGSIAGRAEIFQAALRQASSILVEDVEELFDSVQAFNEPLPKGKNVAIISNAGGLAVLTTDWCYKIGLSVPQFPPEIVEELRSFLPPIASPFNPVDMTGDADFERYKRVLRVIASCKTIHLIIIVFVSQGLITSDAPAQAVVETKKNFNKPLLCYWMGGNSIFNSIKILKRAEIPVYSSPERVAKAAAKLVFFEEQLNQFEKE